MPCSDLLQPGVDALVQPQPGLHMRNGPRRKAQTRAEQINLRTGFSYKVIKNSTD